MFIPIDKQSAMPSRYYEMVIDSINQQIINGDLKKGDLLPSERELADQFQISRVPVREALKTLEFLGVVERIAGVGLVIRQIEVASLLTKAFFARPQDAKTRADLFDMRYLLEIHAAGKAAELRDEQDLKTLQKSMDDMAADIEAGRKPSESSHSFHKAIMAASKNSIMTEIYEFLHTMLTTSFDDVLVHVENSRQSHAHHARLYERIVERDVAGAKSVMREHLNFGSVQRFGHSVIERD